MVRCARTVLRGDILAASCFGVGVEPLGRMLADAGLRGVTTDDGENMSFCRFADDIELFVHPDDLDAALDVVAVYCAATGMFLNRLKRHKVFGLGSVATARSRGREHMHEQPTQMRPPQHLSTLNNYHCCAFSRLSTNFSTRTTVRG